MKFTIDANDLRNACAMVAKAYQKPRKIPVLGNANAMVTVSGDTATIAGTNLDMTITANVVCAADNEVKFTVPFPVLQSFCAGVTGALKFEYAAKPERLGVKCDTFTAEVNLLCPAIDWPVFQGVPDDAHDYTMNEAALHRMFKLARHCISTEEARYYLNGTYLHAHEGMARAVATDGRRLAVIDSEIRWLHSGVIVPTMCCDQIIAMTNPRGNRDVVVRVSDLKSSFTVGDVTVLCKMIDGEYPSYARVIPTQLDGIAATLSSAQIATVKRMMPDLHMGLAAMLDGEKNVLRNVKGYGDVSVQVPIQMTGPSIGFNIQYLAEQARVTPVMQVLGHGKDDPIMIRGDDTKAFWVLMPMRCD